MNGTLLYCVKAQVVVLGAAMLLIGCATWAAPKSKPDHANGNSGGSTSGSPIVSLASDATEVPAGGSVRLSWASANAKFCDAYGSWSGRKSLSGVETIGGLSADARFVLECRTGGDRTSAVVEVAVIGGQQPEPEPVPEPEPEPAPAPSISMKASPSQVAYGGDVELFWEVVGADTCEAAGGWTGQVDTQGNRILGPLMSKTTYSLSCNGSGGTSVKMVEVSVDASTVPAEETPPSPADVPAGVIGDGSIEVMVDAHRYHYSVPAMAVVVTRHGQLAEWAASGVRSVDGTDPVTLQDRWHLGSLTKAITGTLAARLVEEGLIGWNTTIAQVWPEFVGSIRPEYQSVTLAQLMSHASGLRREVFQVPSPSQYFDGAPGTTKDKRYRLSEQILKNEPAVAPGSYLYSNGGYVVAASMLETVAGESWEQMMQTQIFGPLGMNDAGYGAPTINAPYGHQLVSGSLEPVPPGPSADGSQVTAPAGMIHVSLSDYANFMIEHLNGALGIDGINTAASYRYLQTPHFGSEYTIGWFAVNGYNMKLLGHAGSNGFWWSHVWVIPELDVGILVVANAADQNTKDAVRALEKKLVSRAIATP